MLGVALKLVHTVQLLPLLLDWRPVLVVTHLRLRKQVVPLVARVPRCDVVVDRLGPLARDDLNKITKCQRLVWISDLLIVDLQQ